MSSLAGITVDPAVPTPINAVQLNSSKCHAARSVRCDACWMQRLCLTAGSNAVNVSRLEKLIDHWRAMPKEKYIVREGDPFSGIFLVRSGSVKTCQTLVNGEEQITGFHFPGEIFGLEGLFGNMHTNTAVTMETTSLCMLPLKRLLSRRQELLAVEPRFLLLLSELLNRKDDRSVMLSKLRAHERLAVFLWDLSARFERRRLSSSCFYLPMSRTDVSRYLGLSLESVSRAFALLEKDQLIKPNGRTIEITDKLALASLAGAVYESQREIA